MKMYQKLELEEAIVNKYSKEGKMILIINEGLANEFTKEYKMPSLNFNLKMATKYNDRLNSIISKKVEKHGEFDYETLSIIFDNSVFEDFKDIAYYITFLSESKINI